MGLVWAFSWDTLLYTWIDGGSVDELDYMLLHQKCFLFGFVWCLIEVLYLYHDLDVG